MKRYVGAILVAVLLAAPGIYVAILHADGCPPLGCQSWDIYDWEWWYFECWHPPCMIGG